MSTELNNISRNFFILGPIKAEPSNEIKALCRCPYPLHPKGCPNVQRCDLFPLLDEVFDNNVYLGVLQVDVSSLWNLRRSISPSWTERQVRNPIQWQGHFRKDLKNHMEINLKKFPDYQILTMPEGFGDNVFERLTSQSIPIERKPSQNLFMVNYYCRNKKKITYFE